MTDSRLRLGPIHRLQRTVRLVATALLVLVLYLPQPARAGWWDTAAEARESTLAQLRRAPEKWRDVPVVLRVAFTATGKNANPYFTQFTSERWRPITVEPTSDGIAAPGPACHTLFVRRGGREDLRLPALRPGRSLLMHAVVRDVVAGEPWLEVLSITLDGDPLTPEERTRVRAADRFLARSNPAAAEKLYRSVLDGRPLATADRAGLFRKLGASLHDQTRAAEALTALRRALALEPEHMDTRTQIAAIEARLARVPVPPATADERKSVPRNAGRAAPRPPEPETPLYLPGGRPRLAPPGGSSEELRETGSSRDPAVKNGRSPADAKPPRAPLPAPPQVVPPTARPTPSTDRADDADQADDPDEDGDETPEESPPPVPARPALSDPK